MGKPMTINTCYTVDLKAQIKTDCHEKTGECLVDDKLMRSTSRVCLDALRHCADLFLRNWDLLKAYPVTAKPGVTHRKRAADLMVHSTIGHPAMDPDFDRKFPNMPSYMRRAVISDALGLVSSYMSNHQNWEKLLPAERGSEPSIGYPTHYELTFYKQERDLSEIDQGKIYLKLYDGKAWNWYEFRIKPSDARYIAGLIKHRKLLSPVVQKIRGKYQVRFSFEEKKTLVPTEKSLDYVILAVDLGINAAASWSIMTSDGTVHAKGVIHLPCEEDRLRHMMNRKKMYQQAGKKSHSVYRWVQDANRALSIATTQKLMEIAVLYNADCIVFEYLDRSGSKSGRLKERLHMWRANDVQKRVELQAHRCGMRISRICAWNTSRLAYDGSGTTDRRSIYHYKHGKKVYSYSLCTFESGKQYNCDLSASMNIGARYFLREYQKASQEVVFPLVPQRTLNTLLLYVYNGMPRAARV